MEKTIFCANCQAKKPHEASVVKGEITFACKDCDRILKFPATMTGPELVAAIAEHEAVNEGLQLMRTDDDLIEAGIITEGQIQEALASIAALP
jgi:cytochrome c2